MHTDPQKSALERWRMGTEELKEKGKNIGSGSWCWYGNAHKENKSAVQESDTTCPSEITDITHIWILLLEPFKILFLDILNLATKL